MGPGEGQGVPGQSIDPLAAGFWFDDVFLNEGVEGPVRGQAVAGQGLDLLLGHRRPFPSPGGDRLQGERPAAVGQDAPLRELNMDR